MIEIVPAPKRTILVVLIIIALGIFYLTTIREGHDWGGDFSMYIHHAKNIVEGKDYENTGYIYSRFNPEIGPPTYPPIFPLMLSPIYSWFGLNLTAMKVLVVLFFLAFLWMSFLAFTHELPFPYVLGIITVIAFNPYFWDFKDEIRSDIPFVFFVYLSLFLINRMYHSNQSATWQTVYAVLLGISMYLSYGTRSIGIVLIASLVIYDTIKYKTISRFAIIAVLTFIPLMILQNTLLPSDSSYSYVERLRTDAYSIVLKNLYSYAKSCRLFWQNGYSDFSANVLFMGMSILMSIGYVARIKDRTTIFEVFAFVYGISIMLYPSNIGMRGLIPLIPLYVFYLCVGIKYMNVVKEEWEPIIVGVCVSLIVISYVGLFTKKDFGPIKHGIGKRESIDLFDFVRSKTDENDVLLFRKPRVLSLYTGRRASTYYGIKDGGGRFGGELLKYFVEIDGKYLIVGTGGGVFRRDKVLLNNFVKEYEDKFELIYSNVDFGVYRFKPEGRELERVWRKAVGSSG